MQRWIATDKRYNGGWANIASRVEEPQYELGYEDTSDVPELLPCHWRPSVALDPKHRPQTLDKPSSTVRREWWRFPQEAHLLDLVGGRYRRLRGSEIAVLQGFPSDWGVDAGLGELDLIRGYGDAVPPPVAAALFRQITDQFPGLHSHVEICAGFGGMALGAHEVLRDCGVLLVDNWVSARAVLQASGLWPTERVLCEDITTIDWQSLIDRVDILSGGPPCQPWSNAGKGKGVRDDRDLLGYMPELVSQLQPSVFLFENVPGLLNGENRNYANWLIERLRNAAGLRSYGVAAAILNAADFGVPQIRRRVFILGLRGESVDTVHRFFDGVHGRRTHSHPRKFGRENLQPWRTVGEALPNWADAEGRWRRWIFASSSPPPNATEDAGEIPMIPAAPSPPPNPASKRIALHWPHRGFRPRWGNRGWIVSDDDQSPSKSEYSPLCRIDDSNSDPQQDPWYLSGDPLLTLDSLQRTFGRQTDLVYIDAPRISTDAADFAAENSQARLDTWLSLSFELLRSSFRLLADDGVTVVLCGINELPYLQLLLNELLGPQNHVGTISWQKGYSPRNMKNMKDISPTHDNLLVYARRKEKLATVALQKPATGFRNPDNDPRGPWKAEQKGANKPDCDYEVNVAPYRWKLVEGELPPGFWRINPKTGVIYAKGDWLSEPGEWTFVVEVTDEAGNSCVKSFSINVELECVPPNRVAPEWLIARFDKNGNVTNAPQTDGPLRIDTDRLPPACVGSNYFACLNAIGGRPWRGVTRPGKTSASGKARFWEFPESTLIRLTSEDAVDFKSKWDAIPAPKTYSSRAFQPLNQMSTWFGRGKDGDDPFGVGYSQDAKKELEDLFAQKAISDTVSSSKPARLLLRLLALFSREGGTVVDMGSPAAEMASYATAVRRRAIYIEFPIMADSRDTVRLPRLRLASQGHHPIPSGVLFSSTEDNDSDGFVVGERPRHKDSSADITHLSLFPVFATVERDISDIRLDYGSYAPDKPKFLDALASIEGLVPLSRPNADCFGTSVTGLVRAAYLPSSEFLDIHEVERLEKLHADFLDGGGRLRIYYHRGEPRNILTPGSQLELRRVPFDLKIGAGLA